MNFVFIFQKGSGKLAAVTCGKQNPYSYSLIFISKSCAGDSFEMPFMVKIKRTWNCSFVLLSQEVLGVSPCCTNVGLNCPVIANEMQNQKKCFDEIQSFWVLEQFFTQVLWIKRVSWCPFVFFWKAEQIAIVREGSGNRDASASLPRSVVIVVVKF